ncbi:MAG: 16S rRNA (cytosine(1402)-N(4))-methyltransferase, partial [Vicinamibacterales bacterium]
MVAEVLEHLSPSKGGLFVDCTVGLGGHARALLAGGASRLIGIDRDAAALERAREALGGFGDRVELVHDDYRHLAEVLAARGIG